MKAIENMAMGCIQFEKFVEEFTKFGRKYLIFV